MAWCHGYLKLHLTDKKGDIIFFAQENIRQMQFLKESVELLVLVWQGWLMCFDWQGRDERMSHAQR